jgi:hypothetical protein
MRGEQVTKVGAAFELHIDEQPPAECGESRCLRYAADAGNCPEAIEHASDER